MKYRWVIFIPVKLIWAVWNMMCASTAGRRFLQVAFEGNTKPRRARSLYQLTKASRGSKHFKHSHRYLHRHAPHVKGGRCSLLLTEGDLSRTKLRSPPDTTQIIAHHVRSAAAAASLLVYTSTRGINTIVERGHGLQAALLTWQYSIQTDKHVSRRPSAAISPFVGECRLNERQMAL